MILFSLLVMACTTSESSPRHIYNEGSRKLAAQELEEASTQLLDARDKAGSDATLRQYAAYNLALSHAQKGLPLEESDPDAASEEYAKAVSWFRDAIRINPTDEEARYNLEIALKRIQMLADKRNAGKNGLEPRLDRLLEDTRTLRDQMRNLSSQIESTGDLQDPSGYRTQFDALAIQARTLQADASTILQLSGAERSEIENKLEEEQRDQDKMRMAQLSNLDFHLNFGRDEIADARRSLRRLNIEQAFDRLEETVRKVKRAREQLLDPVTVLKVLAQEEEQLTQQTMSLLASKNQDLLIDAGQEEEAKRLPGWFNGTFLSKSQNGISERTKEMLQRFEYAGESDSTEAAPEEQEMMALVQDAVIPLSKASDSMSKAKAALESESFTVAVQEEYQSLLALAQAIERFADAKTLIELSYETQNALLYRITPSEDSRQEDIPEQERLDQVNRSLGENIGRIQRLKGALEREKQKQLQQVQASAGENQEENPADSVHALFEEAERLRSIVQNSLDDMKTAIDTENDG
ncbi:MAG: hypothetical protein VX278_02040, partial [Myxococcota bacterium]|nr:hypothetical protein [Myxococcota bacterium]